ncbi:MAG: exodeoxyribonuclease III [Flavobacteriaceae bacterium]|nr:MAG: exodeoxyribonuclease III [Flavobacteriaceae bacterium]
MKLLSWNVNGIRAIADKNFVEAVRDLDPDILCLQEIKADAEVVASIMQPLQGYSLFVNPAEKKGYSGTALLSRKAPASVDMGPESHPFLPEGRIQCADYKAFYLVNVYVPNSGQGLTRLEYRESWDAAFLEYLKGLHREKPVIVCGDMNVAHRAIDLKNDKSNYNKTAGYTQTEIDGMDRLMRAGFMDVYREKNPEREAYTYWSYRFKARERNIGWRIDYFLLTPELREQVVSAEIYSNVTGSDHCPVGLSLAMGFSG